MDVTTLTPVTLFDGTEILVGLQDGLFKSFPAASFRGKQGPTGIQGIQGNQGQAGSLWWTGSGIPVNGYGSTNDYYLNVNNGDVYTNTAGIWGAVIGNIRGPQGIQGNPGSSSSSTGSSIYLNQLYGGF